MSTQKNILAVSLASLAFVAGCETQPKSDGERPGVIVPAPSNNSGSSGSTSEGRSTDRVLADVQGVKVTESQVMPILLDAYGLDVMLKVVQLNMSRTAAAAAKLTVSPSDVKAERDLSLAMAFPDQKPEDYEALLEQFLGQQRVSLAEFNVVMETNAYLRALVKEASMSDINEEVVRAEFNALYGERVRVRHIAVNNLQEVAEVQRRLNGAPTATPAIPPMPFEQVARQMSLNKATAPLGGAMPEFARTTGGLSEVFVQAAFALKPGEISKDPILEKGFYHLIKVEERLPPKLAIFEDVRGSVREELIRRRQNDLMAGQRKMFANLALQYLKINEPILKKQFDDRLVASRPKPAEKDEVRKSLNAQLEDRIKAATQPATTATVPATTPATNPAH